MITKINNNQNEMIFFSMEKKKKRNTKEEKDNFWVDRSVNVKWLNEKP